MTKRAVCIRCRRPRLTCLCHLAVQIDNPLELLILQHPNEAREAKNTATLLQLSLNQLQLVNGEQFSDHELSRLLYAGNKQPCLLYPSLEKSQHENIPPLPLAQPQQWRLVVVDATWRKSRRMLYVNPLLQKLPRFTLSNPPVGEYRIRKADSENQLSTLEASCYALETLAPGPAYSELLTAFRRFVDQLADFMPDRS